VLGDARHVSVTLPAPPRAGCRHSTRRVSVTLPVPQGAGRRSACLRDPASTSKGWVPPHDLMSLCDSAGCLTGMARSYISLLGCSSILSTRKGARLNDPRNASSKPSEARGLHPMGALRCTFFSTKNLNPERCVMSTERLRKQHQDSAQPFSTRGRDGGRPGYLPAELGPLVQVTTLLDYSAQTTRRTCTRLDDERVLNGSGWRLNINAIYLEIIIDLLPCKQP